jgi:hypothetical protein
MVDDAGLSAIRANLIALRALNSGPLVGFDLGLIYLRVEVPLLDDRSSNGRPVRALLMMAEALMARRRRLTFPSCVGLAWGPGPVGRSRPNRRRDWAFHPAPPGTRCCCRLIRPCQPGATWPGGLGSYCTVTVTDVLPCLSPALHVMSIVPCAAALGAFHSHVIAPSSPAVLARKGKLSRLCLYCQ